MLADALRLRLTETSLTLERNTGASRRKSYDNGRRLSRLIDERLVVEIPRPAKQDLGASLRFAPREKFARANFSRFLHPFARTSRIAQREI